MAVKPIIIPIIPDVSAVEVGIEAIQKMGSVDEMTVAQYKAASKAFAERGKQLTQTASATDKLAAASKKLSESIVGGAIADASKQIQSLSTKIEEGGQKFDMFKKTVEASKAVLKTLSQDSPSFDKLSNEIQAAEIALGGLDKEVNLSIDLLTQYKQALDQLEKAGLQETQIFKDLSKSTKELSDELDRSGDRFKSLRKQIEDSRNTLKGMSKDNPAFGKLSKEVEAAELAIGNFKKEATSSRAQLKQMREALLQLEDAGMENTQVFQDLAIAAGQLEDQIGDTQARIKVLASDTFKFDAGIQALQGVAAAFSIAEGTAALFGDQSEDVQRALVRLNAAMAILTGLQQLQNILQKQSVATIFVENALRRISAASTTLQSLAESRFTVVRVLATGAQNALNAAMAANPAGVLLLAISAAAGALLLFAGNSDKAADSQEDLANATKKVIEALNEELAIQERLRNTRTGGLTQLRQEVAELQARGGARSKIAALESKAIEQEIANAKVRMETFRGVAGAEKEFDDAAAEIVQLRGERRVKDLEAQKAAADEGIQATKKYLDEQKKATQAFLRDQVAANEAAVIEAQGGFEKLVAQIALINAKLRQELANPDLGPNERLAAELKAGEEIKKSRQDLLGDLQKVGIEEVDIFKKKQKEQVLTSAQTAQQQLLIKQEQSNKNLKIIQDEAEEEKKKREEVRQTVISSAISLSNTLAQAAIDISRARAEAEMSILDDQLKNGIISQKEYDNQVRIIKRRQAQDEKKLAVFTAIINTAAAVVKALPNIPLSIAAGILGAAQIAAIVAKPVPQFAKGTKNAPGGLSLVGEAGPELIHYAGKWQYAPQATLLNLPPGSQVVPAADTAKIMQKWDIPVPKIMDGAANTTVTPNIDYKKLGMVIGRELSKLPLNVFGFDKDGPFQYTTKMNEITSYKNTRYGR